MTATPAPAAPAPAPAAPVQEDRGEAYEPETAEETVKALAVVEKTTAIATLADVQELMLADSEQGHGFERGDVALPFMRVLQSGSPQAKKKNPKYVDGAEEGFFFNTATSQVYDGDKGIEVIPVYFTKQATLWRPRVADEEAGTAGGGGFVREITMEEATELLKRCVRNEKNKDITPKGYTDPQGGDNGGLELAISAMYYLLVINPEVEGAFDAVAYPFTSTQLKKSRAWNAIIQNARLPHPSGTGSYAAPMFGFRYRFTTIPESNAKGEWMGLKIEQVGPLLRVVNGVPKEQFPGAAQLYLAARDFRELVASGRVKVKTEDSLEGEEVPSQGGKGDDDEDMPF